MARRKYEEWETTKSTLTSKIRQMWKWSKERRFVIKRDKNTCQKCKRKKSQAKVIDELRQVRKIHVHHKSMSVNWDLIEAVLREELFVHPDELECLCEECHLEVHGKEKK